jgi:hypothetical protein
MKTKTITLYTFDELSDKAKERAIEKLYDINVGYGWWDITYEDAKNIGCEIAAFDTGRGDYCTLKCSDAHDTAEMILRDHGETCDTYKLAEEYMKDHDAIIERMEYDDDGECVNEYETDEKLDALAKEFTRALGEGYLSMLRKEYEYLTSEEAISETIRANGYDFDENGNLA